MSFEQMKTISLVLYIGAGFMFLLTVLLFFKFRIPQVIGFLTGSQERKGVAALRKGGASQESVHVALPKKKQKGKTAKKVSSRNAEAVAGHQVTNEKIRTEELPDSTRPQVASPPVMPPMAHTAQPHVAPPPMAFHSEPTTLLSQTSQEETQLLSPVPDVSAEPPIRGIELQLELELYFYASSIPVE